MASVYRDSARNGWRAQLYVRGVRRKLWLGAVSKAAARSVAVHLDALNLARDTGTVPPESTRLWLSSISDRIRNRLAAWGLVGQQEAAKHLPRTLGPYLQHYIDSRTDWSFSAKTRMVHVRLRLCERLGADTAIASITAGDAQGFARWIRSTIESCSHSGKTISSARQLFKAAIDDRLIADNPFNGINASQQHDEDREAYIPAADIELMIAKADPYFAALFAISRYGGLRVPSEPLDLRWEHINWATGRIVLVSHKTKSRTIPLFPEILPHLRKLYELAPDGSECVFDRYRSTAAKVYRDNILRIAKLCGLQPWPKIWMNLRASCRTDLLERFPSHVVDAWMGHSAKVGAKHYDRITDAHFAAALHPVGSPVGSLPRIPPRSPALGTQKNPAKR